MGIVALLLALAAIWFFLKRQDTNGGLAILTVAWITQLVLDWLPVVVEFGKKNS